MDVVRGENVEPADGWPWFLTPYEVAYVESFNVRPARHGWDGSSAQNDALNLEAEGVRTQQSRQRTIGGRTRPRVKRPWMWWTAVVLILGVGGWAASSGMQNLHTVSDLKMATTKAAHS